MCNEWRKAGRPEAPAHPAKMAKLAHKGIFGKYQEKKKLIKVKQIMKI